MSVPKHELIKPAFARACRLTGTSLLASLVVGMSLILSGCDQGGTSQDSNETEASPTYEAACMSLCKRLGSCVPEMAAANRSSTLGTAHEAQAKKLLDEAKARAAESVKQCSEQLCAKTKGREATKAEADKVSLDKCLAQPTCKKFVGCIESMRPKTKKK